MSGNAAQWITWIPYQKESNYIRYFSATGFFCATVYIFIGIAISSDMFMGSIETICGATRTVKKRKALRDSGGIILVTTKEVPVWNETVANLTLMALGSSAPEILLSTIEICSGLISQHNPGELGPGTIVGSAAFNLMIITAICILSTPKGGTSRIKLYSVFAVTSITSLFAYIWMAVVLAWITPDVVTIWEAVMTLMFFPILIIIAYLTDRKFFADRIAEERNKRVSVVSAASVNSYDSDRDFNFGEEDQYNLYDEDGDYDKAGIAQLYTRLKEIAVLTDKEIVHIIATKLIENKQRPKTWYRNKASRALMGGGTMEPVLDKKLKEVVDILDDSNTAYKLRRMSMGASFSVEMMKARACVQFQAAAVAVPERIGAFEVVITRTGRDDVGFSVLVETVDGSAKANSEYIPVSQVLEFEPYVKELPIKVKIIDNVQWNPDLNFYLHLTITHGYETKAFLGRMRILEVIIEDDDKPGKITFEKPGYVYKITEGKAHLMVVRKKGSDGVVSVAWRVERGPRCTFVQPQSGRLEFNHQELRKYIEIPFTEGDSLAKCEGENETFQVILYDPEGGAKLGKIPAVTCAITDDEKFQLIINSIVDEAVEICEETEQPLSWKEQIRQAVIVNGGDCENATWKHWILHIICFPWKLVCSFVPPPSLCGGWLCFFVSLTVVGFCTKLVGELATNFGKAIDLNPTITAITFVALGTSLPDTFASRIAAMNDKTADNAIGNVTGSNSVNVFLGLGVPWVIGAIFYEFVLTKDAAGDLVHNPFCVPAGSLTFNVLIYTACAIVTLLILIYRRYTSSCGKAELGGPTAMKWIAAITMTLLWVVYIVLSSWEAQTHYMDKFLNPKQSYCSVLVEHYKNED